MKKQPNLPAGGRKLSLNKRIISNLTAAEMGKHVGGISYSCFDYCHHTKNCTRNQNTCPGHKTC